MKSIVTLIAFKVCWLSVVFGAVLSMEWIGLFAVSAFAAYEVLVRDRRWLVWPTVIVGLLGYAVDNVYVLTGLMEFSDPGVAYAPYWMALLWVNFALIVEHGLSWLSERRWLAAALGAIGGPMAYLAGVKLGLIELIAPNVLVIAVIAMTWAIAMPLLLYFLGSNRREEKSSWLAGS